MQPFSYTSLKIVHDQQIQEALERQRLYAGQPHRQGMLQAFGKFLARFTNQPGRKQKEQDRRSSGLSSMLQ